MILIAIIAGVIALLVLSALWPWAIGAAWTPTPMTAVRRMLQLAGVGPQDTVYDMGCGDGRIVITAAREFGARAVGIEIEPLRFLVAWLRARFSHERDRVTIRWGNIFNRDLTGATVVTLFLTDKANNRLRARLCADLGPRSRVVSYLWTFDDWAPSRTDHAHRIYLYEVKP
jgi:methylase of polypeptide subunit release factors